MTVTSASVASQVQVDGLSAPSPTSNIYGQKLVRLLLVLTNSSLARMLSIGKLIWLSFRPLIRLVISAGFGFALTKAGLFSSSATQGAGHIMLNITIPCLMFSKIVPAFTPENISALGPLVLVAILYELLGIGMAFIIKFFCWVPHRFRYGILVAGGWGNWNDIPTSAIMSITGTFPFKGMQDQDLAIAYISVFLLVMSVTLFPLGGYRWIVADFHGPEVTDDEVRHLYRQKRKNFLPRRTRASANDVRSIRLPPLSSRSEIEFHSASKLSLNLPSDIPFQETANTHTHAIPASHRFYMIAHDLLKHLCNPVCLVILLSFLIALVPILKALFVPVPGTYIHPAPDGQPPLALLLDAATFIGAASVPLGLICLGSAFARLQVGMHWNTLPLGAIGALAVGKMFIMPILGILICRGLLKAGVINAEDKVLQFVCMFFSCLPTSSAQVFLTQVYSGTGSAEHLSPFLFPQYVIMFGSMTAFTAYSLHFLF